MLYIEQTIRLWGISSAGRAPDLHSGGQRFDPVILHHLLSCYDALVAELVDALVLGTSG